MTGQVVQNVYTTFTDSDGSPLDGGYVYFGLPNLMPVPNQIATFWDKNLTVPAPQPFRTTGGYIYNAGSPANVWVNGTFSVLVLDANGVQVYYNQEVVNIPLQAADAAAAGAAASAAAAAVSAAAASASSANASAASAAAGAYPSTASANVPRGLTQASVGAITPGAGGTNGTFNVAWSGGNFSVNPTATFTVAGGVLTAVTITGPGLYIGSAPTVPAPSFAASAGLAGAAVALTAQFLVTAGNGYWVQNGDWLTRYKNVANVATLDTSVDPIPLATYVKRVHSTEADHDNLSREITNSPYAGPGTIFGSALMAYFDPHSRYTNAAGAEATANITKIHGAGKYGRLTANTAGISQVDSNNILRFINKLSLTLTATGLGAEWLAGARPFYFCIGNMSLSTLVLWGTATFRLIADRPGGDTLNVKLQKNIATVWTDQWTWTTSFATAQANSPIQTFTAIRFEFRWNTQASYPTVLVGGVELAPLTSTAGLNLNTSEEVTFGPTATAVGPYALCFATDHTPGDGDRLYTFLQRPMEQSWTNGNKPIAASHFELWPVHKRSLYPRPKTLNGPYYADNTSGLTIGATVAGNLPTFPMPAGPNVPPWDGVHDRTKLDASVTRPMPFPHPDDPTNPNKLVMLMHAGWQPDAITGNNYVVVYESTDGGASFTRYPVSNPGAALPVGCTSTTNNIVSTAGAFGRAMYVGDSFPNGYTPPGMTQSFKYFFLFESIGGSPNGMLYGFNDPRQGMGLWTQIPIRKFAIANHPTGLGSTNTSQGSQLPAAPGFEIKDSLEEKGIYYDSSSNRFFRVIKIRQRGFRPNALYQTDYHPRSLFVSWSEVGDITRWNPPVPLIEAPHTGYEAYDCDILQISYMQWMIFVYYYTGYGIPAPGGAPFASRSQHGGVDVYLSTDRLATPPLLLRADWMVQNLAVDSWIWGLIYANKHPAGNGKIYVTGFKGRHDDLLQFDGTTVDYQSKVALVNYTFPSTYPTLCTPDRTTVEGRIATDQFLGSRCDGVRVEATGGVIRARVLDANGRPIPGLEFQDSVWGEDQIMVWNGNTKLPPGLVSVEVDMGGAVNFSGIYPIPKDAVYQGR